MAQPAQRPLLHVSIVTQSGSVFDGVSDEVVAPGGAGQLGILPRHAPLMTTLTIGALHIKHNGGEETFFIGGGFMQVLHNQVNILADDAEHAADIDEAHAEEARRRAQQSLDQQASDVDTAALQGEIQRALGRIHVAEIARRRGSGRRPQMPPSEP